ncbi:MULTISPECIES: hypothetical protein [unclassified Bradyrhizobium]
MRRLPASAELLRWEEGQRSNGDAQRGFGALALTAFAFLIIWGTWKSDKPVGESARKLMIRQAAAFEPAAETPAAPITTASIPVATISAAPATAASEAKGREVEVLTALMNGAGVIDALRVTALPERVTDGADVVTFKPRSIAGT